MNLLSSTGILKCQPAKLFSFVSLLSAKPPRIIIIPRQMMNHPKNSIRLAQATLATKSNNNNNNKQLLVNEALVQAIRKRARNVAPQDIQVRLLMPNPSAANHANNNTTQLLSLPQAVQLSVQQKRDLIGISLQQDVPVLRMDHLNSFLYKQEKETTNKQQQRKTTKEVHMQHKIAPHDMERKLQQVTKFLEKGHNCVIKMPVVLLDTVLTQLPPSAELMHPPQLEGQKALIRVHSK